MENYCITRRKTKQMDCLREAGAGGSNPLTPTILYCPAWPDIESPLAKQRLLGLPDLTVAAALRSYIFEIIGRCLIHLVYPVPEQ